jgi:RimJ/RimL family protein N-acetyltransferase
MDYEIRPVSPNDAETLFSLVNQIKDEEKYLFFTLRFPREGTRKYIESHTAAGNPTLGAYTEKGELAGWIDFNIGSFEEIRHTATIGMGIAKDHRGKGLGKRLLSASFESARKLGLEKLELEVFETNTVARSLYSRMGFVEEGCLRKKRKFKGNYEDIICMGLFLDQVIGEPAGSPPSCPRAD